MTIERTEAPATDARAGGQACKARSPRARSIDVTTDAPSIRLSVGHAVAPTACTETETTDGQTMRMPCCAVGVRARIRKNETPTDYSYARNERKMTSRDSIRPEDEFNESIVLLSSHNSPAAPAQTKKKAKTFGQHVKNMFFQPDSTATSTTTTTTSPTTRDRYLSLDQFRGFTMLRS